MICSRCPHNGKHSPACLKCKDTTESASHSGQTFVSLDNLPDGFDAEAHLATSDTPQQGQPYEYAILNEERDSADDSGSLAIPNCCEDTARKVLAAFMQLEPLQVRLVFLLHEGKSLRTIAQRLAVKKQAIHISVKRLVRHHPEFSFLLPKSGGTKKRKLERG